MASFELKSAPAPNPLWALQGVVEGEPLLWVRERADFAAEAKLLFRPKRILRLYRANRSEDYDFSQVHIEGVTLRTRLPVPGLLATELFPDAASERTIERHSDGRRFLHFSEGHYFHDLQVCVDYETEQTWEGPAPARPHDHLRRTMAQIRGKHGLRIAVLGDSISTGANASARYGVLPMQAGYAQLLGDSLAQRAGGVFLDNFSQGGKTAAWGLTQLGAVIAQKPDLMIIAFGMNDASEGVSPEMFGRTVGAMIEMARRRSSETEFIVLSGMSPNPAWHLARPSLRAAYHVELLRLAGGGVAVADIRSIWDHVVTQKGFLSVTGNGVNHPNDFGHRIYADCVQALLMDEASRD